MPQRFTMEFEEEAVRLVRTSGRTKREVAADLGLGGYGPGMRWCGLILKADGSFVQASQMALNGVWPAPTG